MIPSNLAAELAALAQVVVIDLTLAGDNAVVIGLAVRHLHGRQRALAIAVGVGAAAVFRLGLGAIALRLLEIIGLVLAGGVLLLWVCWRMYRDLRHTAGKAASASPASLGRAMIQIALADISMSLDNVLAVAGAAHEHFWVLATGLTLSVLLMGLAAGLVARLLERHRWIAWIGLAVVLFVALRLIWEGGWQVAGHVAHGG